MICIVNIGIGNFNSIYNMLNKLDIKSKLTNSYEEISNADYIILPGVGSFDRCIQALKNSNLHEAIYSALSKNAKLLGICVGMQMLFNDSEEGNEKGLSLIEGNVVKFKNIFNLSVPHMGWNKVKIINKNNIFSNEKYERFYFAHSYYCVAKNKENIISTTDYGVNFCSSIQYNNIYGFQFHPEKSHEYGKNVLYNFLTKC